MTPAYRIHTRSILPVVGSELTEDLNKGLVSLYDTSVESSSLDYEPPAAGFSEIAFTIVATSTFGLLFKFFEPLVVTAGEAYRNEVLRLIRSGRRSKESGRGYVPLQVALGEEASEVYPVAPVRYYFHGSLDEEALLKRLEAANEHVHTIPPEYFSGPGGPSENGFFWDDEHVRWRGVIWHYPDPPYGEYWIPPGVLDPDN